ncbi:MAG: hypothetical protein ABIA04_02315 [Pseudomonadota bacterium]
MDYFSSNRKLPAIIAFPGHGETAESHLADNVANDFIATDIRKRFVRELANEGYLIFILNPRAYDMAEVETYSNEILLRNGHSLVGMRAYEILLAQKFLKWFPDVDNTKIALMGHSGGSSASNIAIRLNHQFAALATDLLHDYMNSGMVDLEWLWAQDQEEWAHVPMIDSFAPMVWPFSDAINQFDTAIMPASFFPYGYDSEEMPFEEVLDFLNEHLNPHMSD